MLDNYAPGTALAPDAPWNQRQASDEEEGDQEGCPNPSRYCRCEHCQAEMADLAYDQDR